MGAIDYVVKPFDAIELRARVRAALRTKLYQEAQKIVIGDAAYVYLFQRNSEVAMRSDVKGFVYNPMLEQIYNLGEMSKAK